MSCSKEVTATCLYSTYCYFCTVNSKEKCRVPRKFANYLYRTYCTCCTVNSNEKCQVPRKFATYLYSTYCTCCTVNSNEKCQVPRKFATCLYSTYSTFCTVNSNEKCRVPRKLVQPICTVHIVPVVQWTRMRSVGSPGSLQPVLQQPDQGIPSNQYRKI